MTAAEKHPTKAALIAGFAAIYLIWGSTYLAIRIAVESIPPFLMAGIRFLVAGIIIATFIALTRGFRATAKQWRDNAIVAAFLCLGGNGLVSWGEQKVPSGIATLIISVGPVFVVLADWAVHAYFKDGKRGTQPRAMTFVGLALGIVGLLVLVGPDVLANGATRLDPRSVVALLGATTSWSVGMVYMRYVSTPAEPFTASGIQMLCGSAWLIATSLLLGEFSHVHIDAISKHSIMAWIYLVLFGSLVGFSTFTWLMKHSTPARVSTYAYVNPVVAVFLGWLIAHEPVSPRIFLAAGIIIAGVAIITVTKNKQPAAPAVATTEPARERA